MIAFVVVASVFAMTTLQTGIFSAEQGKEVALSGLDLATGSLQLRGFLRAVRGDVDVDGNDVILLSGVDDQTVAKVIFTVVGALGSSMTDLTPPHTFNDTGTDPDASGLTSRSSATIQTDSFLINDAAWTVTFPGTDNGDYILDGDERAEITIWLHTCDNVNSLWDLGNGTSDPYVDAPASLIGVSDDFTIQFHPAKGNTLNIQRTLPVVLRPQMDLR
jgi:archaellin